MDCEKFDQHVIEALYDELDELTHAALKRHVEGCSRCASVWAGLRATREVGILPLEEPPADLEDRILEAAAGAQRHAPWPKKVLRGLAWAGSHAMRPQLAMAALFFLVIGSSLLLLRARPGTMAPVSVTERGSPSPDLEQAAGPRAAAASPPAAAATALPVAVASTEAAPAATAALSDGVRSRAVAGGDEAPTDPSVARKGSADEGRAALADARAARDGAGCAAAVAKLDAVAVAYRGTQFAADAMWDEATCYAQMGDDQKAQQLYLALRSTGYRERAEAQIASAEAKKSNNVTNQAAGAAAVAARAAPAAPAAAPPVEASANASNARNAAGPANAGRAAAPKPAKAAVGDPGRAYRAAPARDAAGF